jgi:hypothetical protein
MNSNTPDQAELIRKVHIIACAALGLDDEDHEDDEAAEPLEKAILALIAQQPSTQAIERAKEELLFDLDEIDNKPWRVFRQLAKKVPDCAEMYERYQRFYENGGANEVEKLIEQFEARLTEPDETGRKA